MYKRLLQLPLTENQSLFLFGPRSTGKTSWLKSTIPNGIFIDLLDFNYYKDLLANPTRLRNMIPDGYKSWIIIDEVQRIPELLHEVHRLIEEKKYKFILTGSSARSLKKQGTNLLGGRALRYHMHPLTAQELGKDFNFINSLRYGLLPKVINNSDPERYLKNYIQTYIKEEVQQEGLTRNLGSFARFLEVINFSQGNVINASEIAREVGTSRVVVSSYVEILQDLLLATQVPVFTHRAKRKLIASQKFYLFDTGVYHTLRPKGPLDSTHELDGAGLETLFLQSVRAINDYLNFDYSIYFWRTISGTEVDFILYGPRGLHAFEIKRASYVSPSMFKGLRSFAKEYPQASLYLLYTGDKIEYHDNITVLPIDHFLKTVDKIIA